MKTPTQPDVQVDTQTPDSWFEVMSLFADASLYQTWGYGSTLWGAKNLSHFILLKDHQIQAAAQLRIMRFPFLPIGIAYLPWGPLCHQKQKDLDPLIVSQAITALRQEYCGRRRLSLMIAPHAFLGDARCTAFEAAFSQTGLHPEPARTPYQTILVDLSPDLKIIREQLQQKWRNLLNHSEKNELDLQISDDLAAYRTFLELYRAMWERKRFRTSVQAKSFGRIQELLPPSAKIQFFTAYASGRPIAALACSLLGETGIYLFGATNERARELKASYFLQWHAIRWLKESGARYYDLGGINRLSDPGGYHFKSGLGGKEVTQLTPHTVSKNAFETHLLHALSLLRQHRSR